MTAPPEHLTPADATLLARRLSGRTPVEIQRAYDAAAHEPDGPLLRASWWSMVEEERAADVKAAEARGAALVRAKADMERATATQPPAAPPPAITATAKPPAGRSPPPPSPAQPPAKLTAEQLRAKIDVEARVALARAAAQLGASLGAPLAEPAGAGTPPSSAPAATPAATAEDLRDLLGEEVPVPLAPVKLPVDEWVRNIPPELKALPHWVAWGPGRDGRGKTPYNVETLKTARANDAASWRDFASAALAYKRTAKDPRTGVGFAFGEQPCGLVGVDFDLALDPVGELYPWAAKLLADVELLGGAFIEVSPSGRGLHLIARGELPCASTGGAVEFGDVVEGAKRSKVEAYHRGRYFTMSGRVWRGHREIAVNGQAILDGILAATGLAAKLACRIETPAVNQPPDLGQLADDLRRLEVLLPLLVGHYQQKGELGYDEWWRTFAAPIQGSFHGTALWPEAKALFARATRALPGFREGDESKLDDFRRAEGARRTVASLFKLGDEVAPGWRSAARREEQGEGDLRNASRLVDRARGKFLAVCHEGVVTWLRWDSRRWARDGASRIFEVAAEVARSYFSDAATAAEAGRPEQSKALAKHAVTSQCADRIEAMVRLAGKAFPDLKVSPDLLDADPWLLNVANGTIDLRTGSLRPHDPADHITRLCPVAYEPAAASPRFERFLAEVIPSAAVRDYVRRAAGYSLTGVVTEHALFLLVGDGQNGKGVLMRLLRRMLAEYAVVAPPDLLIAKYLDPHPADLASLEGGRFVYVSEVPKGRPWNEARLKALAGGDPIKARGMRENFREIAPVWKLWAAVNDRPHVRGPSDAVWMRLKEIRFPVSFRDASDPSPEVQAWPVRDPELEEKIAGAELPGVLAWAVRGCLEWQRGGLREPAEVRGATAEYRRSEDHLAPFLAEHPVTKKVRLRNLYADVWAPYCRGINESPGSVRDFAVALRKHGIEVRDSTGGAAYAFPPATE